MARQCTRFEFGVMCFPPETEVKVDRPFYYQIVEEETQTMLFVKRAEISMLDLLRNLHSAFNCLESHQ